MYSESIIFHLFYKGKCVCVCVRSAVWIQSDFNLLKLKYLLAAYRKKKTANSFILFF